MGAKIKPLHANPLLTSAEALDALLRSIDSKEVKEALMQWFEIGLHADPPLTACLNHEQLALFMDKIPDLVLVLYTYQSEERKEETNEH